ncbi:MAG TPA: ABC transporter ATP-binding protein, partial [Candidatus Limnocylindrales bacterium]|nr:ABC transporter ATP-binding protein [Candidatus Limnocylindrales bacterium]
MTDRAAAAGRAIRADDVGFSYAGSEASALDGVSFELAAGEALLIVGPSGSGKSTLAKAIAGIVPREVPGDWRGVLELAGRDGTAEDEGPADVGIVFQDPASQLVMEHAGDDVAFGLESRAWPLVAMRRRVPIALAAVGLDEFGDRRSDRLSGGEQQRLALAGVLAPEPDVLVLDEPMANLDPEGAEELMDRLVAIRDARSATIVLVDHRTDRAWSMADRVLALGSGGRQIDVGPPNEVLARSAAAMAAEGI